MDRIKISNAWREDQWSCSMHARPLIWSQSWFWFNTFFRLIFFSFLFIILLHIYFISKQWIELELAMHGGRISGAVACMHGRWFDLKADFNLTHCLFYFFCTALHRGEISGAPPSTHSPLFHLEFLVWHTHRHTHISPI